MPGYQDILARYFPASARAGRRQRASKVEALSEEEVAGIASKQRHRSLFESVLDYLDLPGTAVRSIFTGQPGKALRAVGSFALPGIVDQPEDRPNFGFVGNLLTDPLIWFTGGTGGARAALAAAGKLGAKGVAKGAVTRSVARALASGATKAGRRAFEEGGAKIAAKAALRLPGATTAVEAATLAAKAEGAAARGGAANLLKIARKAGQRPQLVEEMFGKGLLDRGGLKIGLPFTEGRTVAGAGKAASIAQASPFYWVGKAIWKVAKDVKPVMAARAYTGKLLSKLYAGRGMTEVGKLLQATRNATTRRIASSYADEFADAFKGFAKEEQLHDFHQTLTGNDLRGSGVTDPDTFRAIHPGVPYDEALQKYRAAMDRMKNELVERGIWQPEIPAEVVQRRLAHLYPDEAHALKEANKKFVQGEAPMVLGGEGQIEVFKRQVLHEAKGHDEARAWAKAFKEENPAIQGVKVRRRPGAGTQPWEVTVRAHDKEMVDLASLKLPENLAYAPQQFSDEALARIEKINLDAALEGNARGTMEPRASLSAGGTKNVFMKERKFAQEDFLDFAGEVAPGAAPLQNQNIAELALKRAAAHARTIADFDMLRQARKTLGSPRTLGVFDDELSALNGLDEARAAAKTPAAQQAIRLEQTEKGAWKVLEGGDTSLRDKAFADWIRAGRGHVAPREGIWKALGWWNRKLFKPYVTIGLGPVPNPAFHIRNIVSGVWMAASHPKIGLASGLKHVVQIAYDGIAKAVEAIPGFKGTMPRSQLTRVLRGDVTDAAVAGTHYTERSLAALLDKHGVTRNNFPRMEEMLPDLEAIGQRARRGTLQGTKRVAKALVSTKIPGRLAEAIEDRMRAQGFVAALKKGLLPEQAAQAAREAFIDYEMVSALHRNIRDVIPFAQFTIGQTPRTVETLLRNPRVLSPLLAAGVGGREGIVPPWVAEQPFSKIGTDEQGNPTYAVGASTPFEDIGRFFPGTPTRALQRAAGSMTPPLKFLAEQIAGKNLHFGTEEGSYRAETPVTSILPDWFAGRKRRTIKTAEGGTKDITEVAPGLHRALTMLPITRQLQMANQLFDKRKTVWQKSISLLTGVKVVSVDEARELKKIINGYLKERAEAGDVGQFQRFYDRGDVEPELGALIKAFYAAQRK